MKPRVAVVVSHPIQHFCPLYRALASDGTIELKVFFGSTAGVTPYFDKDFGREVSWDASLLDGYVHEFLPGAENVTDLAKSIDNPALRARLEGFDANVVVAYGFFHRISRIAYAWARRNGRRALTISDSEIRTPLSRWTRLRKRLTVPLLFRSVDGFLTVGDCNEAYYLRYGARRDQLHRSPFPVDENLFAQALAERDTRRAQIRASIGAAEDDCVALAVGKLRGLKRHDDAIRAVARAVSDRGATNLKLVIVGDGEQGEFLHRLARELPEGHIHLPGFIPVADLPDWYVAADVLVHPSSQDRHPLATSEAVVCGLPCIVSDRVGSVGPTDDVRPGVNGIEVPVGDVDALAEALALVAQRPDVRDSLAQGSKSIAAERTMRASVAGFLHGVLCSDGGAP